jgi:hypothetical protein
LYLEVSKISGDHISALAAVRVTEFRHTLEIRKPRISRRAMRVQLADSDQPHALSAAVRFGVFGRRYILVVFDDRPVGLLSHADGSGLFPEARSKLIVLSWEEIRLTLMLDIVGARRRVQDRNLTINLPLRVN